ncbi:beta-galactosidase [Parvularcula sp. IMCC14364]|uniref:beta-galactosidase n=1 Tax=Parvularcula sp. IMCC14364 TaxID=3067902 RepID=UPI002741E731|nr:beta-galactosidase [Parvularcula sp. IMCC14364]
MANELTLGVCYYPEHWPEHMWADDAKRVADIGISRVRIGEFAWSRIEPEQGNLQWEWLDRAMDTLGSENLQVILGTPTATPPKWLVDAHPDILAYDEQGQPRKFGSRRHYCFSSLTYRRETTRICKLMAERYAAHPALFAWQTDNEYGCHDTTRSWSPEATKAFRLWLKEKFRNDIAALNKAWGTVFWSQEYTDFSQIDLPNMTVTEATPAHMLDFYRFSSDQVVSFNKLQCDILRAASPGKAIIHNFMGIYTGFDHFKVSRDLDIASWDSYPLGFLDVAPFPVEDKHTYLRQGHPDFTSFHHDLYRACGKNGRWWVMEQQPGPVNWAHHNPAPLPGMVRTWSWEAFAHGAETVSYFRWRQAPFAQEQFHAGLNLVNNEPAPATLEAREVSAEIAKLGQTPVTATASIALVFSYEAKWLFDIQPQGASWSYWELVLTWYGAARRLGLDVDIIPPDADLSAYSIVLVPSLPILPDGFIKRLQSTDAHIVLGPRTGSKTRNVQVPPSLAPGDLQTVLPLKILHSESLREDISIRGQLDGREVKAGKWLDHVQTEIVPAAVMEDGTGLLFHHANMSFFTTVPDGSFILKTLIQLCTDKRIPADILPEHVRIRRRGDVVFAFNYGPDGATIPKNIRSADGALVFGSWELPPAGTACWRIK